MKDRKGRYRIKKKWRDRKKKNREIKREKKRGGGGGGTEGMIDRRRVSEKERITQTDKIRQIYSMSGSNKFA